MNPSRKDLKLQVSANLGINNAVQNPEKENREKINAGENMSFILNPSESSGPRMSRYPTKSGSIKVLASICPYSFMVNKPFLVEYVPWLSRTFGEVEIWTGDYFERHNMVIFEGRTAEEALKRAIQKGEKIKKTILNIKENFKLKNIQYLDLKKVTEEPTYLNIINEIKKYSKMNNEFDTNITDQTITMTSNSLRSNRSGVNPTESDIENLKNYLFEELSFYLTMYSKGYPTEVYPGRDLEYMKKISRGEFLGFPFDFSQRTHLSVTRKVKE